MSITSEQVTEYLREKTIHFAEQKRENPSLESLFISKSELFVELGAENVEDKETIIQCASSFIDMYNSNSEKSLSLILYHFDSSLQYFIYDGNNLILKDVVNSFVLIKSSDYSELKYP